jgi:hypothetical protein
MMSRQFGRWKLVLTYSHPDKNKMASRFVSVLKMTDKQIFVLIANASRFGGE